MPFSPELKSYLITQWNCTTTGSCRCRKTNQWVGSGAARTYGDDTCQIPRRNGRGIWLYKRSFRHRILRFFLLQRRRLRLHWSGSLLAFHTPRSRTHQKASHEKPLGTPFFSGCRGNCVCCYRVRTSDHATVRCDSGKNKTQTFSKREQFSSSVPHECPASMQPTTRVYPTPCHAGRGLAGHPRSVRVGYGDNKTRLFTPISSKTPALQRHGSPPRCTVRTLAFLRSEVMTLLEKGAIEMVSPALSESGFYSRYFLVPKKDGGLRPILDLRRLNYAPWDGRSGWSRWSRSSRRFVQRTGSVLWTWKTHTFTSR